ncbi:MAG: hypothetical protein Q8R92_16760 [Deltaproteobacteria bacterium]|nr:hypothetical protein [Deltaproteobacteria bacterium]
MRIKAYTVVERAVDEGVALGYNRAHKHTDTPGEAIKEYVRREVMIALCEIMDFGEE